MQTQNENAPVKTPNELLTLVKTLEKCVNKMSNSYRGGRKQTGKDIECYNCHKLGHTAKYCHFQNTSARVEKDKTTPPQTSSVKHQEN